MDERVVFCPACGAPQIRVPLPAAETQEPAPENETEGASGPAIPSRPAAPRREGIQWKVFFTTASPLAALTGFLAFLFSPLTVVVVLPLSLRRIMSRYRPYHSGILRSGQGARLGAFMALLSFAAFLIFFLATLSLNRAPLLARIHELATQNPDPQVQQALLWFTSNTGFIVITSLTLLFFLIMFEIVGMISGAIMAAPKNRM